MVRWGAGGGRPEGEPADGQQHGEPDEDRHAPTGSAFDASAEAAREDPGVDGQGQDDAAIRQSADAPRGVTALEGREGTPTYVPHSA